MVTKSKSQTQRIAAWLAKKLLKTKSLKLKAQIIALSGDLGSGKTTFIQGFCQALGVQHGVSSPTFIIFRKHPIKMKNEKLRMKKGNIYHFDLYRLRKPKEVLDLGFKKIINNPENIVLIEWPEIIKKLLPKNTIWVKFSHGKKENERFVKIQ
jgi:tRNA threonylcarbamoyladenosine biosynthesis protein TsaE